MLGLGTRGKVLYGLCLQVLSTVCGFMWALTKEARDIRIYRLEGKKRSCPFDIGQGWLESD